MYSADNRNGHKYRTKNSIYVRNLHLSAILSDGIIKFSKILTMIT